MILNPHDTKLIEVTRDYGSKLWLMSLNGQDQYCNPSVENIVKEVFLAMDILTKALYKDAGTGLRIHKVLIYETPNCWTECFADSVSNDELTNFSAAREDEIRQYALDKGKIEYDDRKL